MWWSKKAEKTVEKQPESTVDYSTTDQDKANGMGAFKSQFPVVVLELSNVVRYVACYQRRYIHGYFETYDLRTEIYRTDAMGNGSWVKHTYKDDYLTDVESAFYNEAHKIAKQLASYEECVKQARIDRITQEGGS